MPAQIKCRYCNTIYSSYLLNENEACTQVFQGLSAHIMKDHQEVYAGIMNKIAILPMILGIYIPILNSGMFDPSMSLTCENVAEKFMNKNREKIEEILKEPGMVVDGREGNLVQ